MPAKFRFAVLLFYRLTMECTCVHNVVGALQILWWWWWTDDWHV